MIGIKIDLELYNSIISDEMNSDDWSTYENNEEDSVRLIIDEDIPCAQSKVNNISFDSESIDYSTPSSDTNIEDNGNDYESLALFFEN